MPAGSSGRRASRPDQRLGLLEIARARVIGEEEATTLPPGQRDASGFWFPAGYRNPLELFTPHQRTLQARQRALKARNGRAAESPPPPPAEDVALPLLITEVAPAAPAAAAGRHHRPRDAEPRTHRPPSGLCVDSPGRSV